MNKNKISIGLVALTLVIFSFLIIAQNGKNSGPGITLHNGTPSSCAATQLILDYASGKIYTCVSGSPVLQSTGGSTGISNGAGNNVIPKSDGTNLVASTLSDTGSLITATSSLKLNAGTKTTLAFKMNSTGCYERVAGVLNCLQEGATPQLDLRPGFGEVWLGNAGGGFGLVNANDVTLAAASANMSLCASSTNICFGTGAAGSFANNIKTTNANLQGSLIIGNGATILKHLTGTATLDFANLAAIGCEDLTITVTGAALGDTVYLGVPNASIVANGNFFGWVSATDTVSVRFCTVVSGNPASGSFRADVWQH